MKPLHIAALALEMREQKAKALRVPRPVPDDDPLKVK
jgi:hypothetical protein